MEVWNFDFKKYVQEKRAAVEQLTTILAPLKLSASPSLPSVLADSLERGLEQLNALDRSDPLWQDTNGLPTESKLLELAERRVKENPEDPTFRWIALADGATHGASNLPVDAVWKTSVGRECPIQWFVEAAYLEYCNWGLRVPMMPVVRELGREQAYREALQEILKNDELQARWINFELSS